MGPTLGRPYAERHHLNIHNTERAETRANATAHARKRKNPTDTSSIGLWAVVRGRPRGGGRAHHLPQMSLAASDFCHRKGNCNRNCKQSLRLRCTQCRFIREKPLRLLVSSSSISSSCIRFPSHNPWLCFLFLHPGCTEATFEKVPRDGLHIGGRAKLLTYWSGHLKHSLPTPKLSCNKLCVTDLYVHKSCDNICSPLSTESSHLTCSYVSTHIRSFERVGAGVYTKNSLRKIHSATQ